MFDTVVLNYPNTVIPKRIYSDWDTSWMSRKGNYTKICHSFAWDFPNKVPIKYYYYPYNLNGLLKIEFSVPKVIFGNNIQMIKSIKDAIDNAGSSLPSIPGIPHLDLWNGIIFRLDPCYNHQVGDFVPYYIDALQSLSISRRETISYASHEVLYKNKQVSTKFYDKEKESDDKAAYGILRQETILRRNRVKKLMGLKNPTLNDLTPDMLFQALENDLSDLNLLNISIGTADTTLNQLCDAYGEDAGIYYYGLLQAGKNLNKERLIKATNSHPRSLERRLKKIIDANVAKTITHHTTPLPPLTIDRNYFDPNK